MVGGIIPDRWAAWPGISTLTSLYAKDAILLPQGVAEPVTGEADIRKFFDAMAAGPKLDNFTVTEAEANMVDPKTIFVGDTGAVISLARTVVQAFTQMALGSRLMFSTVRLGRYEPILGT